MGARKRLMAERLKEIKKQTAIAKLNNEPSSPRKMRLVADIVRGVEVNRAMDILRYSKKAASRPLEKLIKSAVANWEAKNPDKSSELDNGNVIVKTIMVDEGRTQETSNSGGINYGTENKSYQQQNRYHPWLGL